MIDQSKTKIVGAFVIGFAIVGAAFVVKNFTTPPNQNLSSIAAQDTVAAPTRNLIEVTDNDSNGLEDWRDQFVKSSPITIAETGESSYEAPDTLTGQVGVAFLQNIITAEGQGSFGRTQEQIITDTIDQISVYGTDIIFDVRNITISQDTSNEEVRAYGNAMADAIVDNSVPGLRNELLILRDVVAEQSETGAKELETISQVYANTRDEMLLLPVPAQFVKEHLDLINVFHALSNDIKTMSSALNDPMLSLVRLKRYEEDAQGLALALRNMYLALEPFAAAFEQNDSAILFVAFSPNVQ